MALTLQAKERLRWNLLEDFSGLRAFLRSETWPEGIKYE